MRWLSNVLVTRDGRPVENLTAEDFEIFDNGVRQTIERIQVETAPVQAFVLLDHSASVAGPKLQKLRTAVRSFLSGMRPRDQAALLTFFDHVQLKHELTEDLSLLLAALDETDARGGTALYDALYATLKLAEPPVTRPVLVLFTDGEDTTSRFSNEEVLEVARGTHAVVYAVGFSTPTLAEQELFYTAIARESVWATRFNWTGKVNMPSRHLVLRALTESSGGRLWYADADSNLQNEFKNVLEEIQSRYLISFYPDGVAEEGWHELDVRLKNRKGDVHARRGYLRPSTNP